MIRQNWVRNALALLGVLAILVGTHPNTALAERSLDVLAQGPQITTTESPEYATQQRTFRAFSALWNTGEGPGVFSATGCQVLSDPAALLKLNCGQYETRWQTPFAAIDLFRWTANSRSIMAGFPILLTADGNLHTGPVVNLFQGAPAESPILEAIAQPASAAGKDFSAGFGIHWNTGSGSRFIRILQCRTQKHPDSLIPYDIFCSGSLGQPSQSLPQHGASMEGVSRTDPHWAFAVGLLGNGQIVVSNVAFIDPNYLSKDTTLALRGEAVSPKSTYQAGEELRYNVYLKNTGSEYSKAHLASIHTGYEQRGLKLIATEGPWTTDETPSGDANRPAMATWFDPSNLAPGQEQLIASFTFEVVKTYYPSVSVGSYGYFLGMGIDGRFNFQAEVAD